jgi:hypothetical protein
MHRRLLILKTDKGRTPRSVGVIRGQPALAEGGASSTVGDGLARMGEWSPGCKVCWWDEGSSREVGS